MMLTLSKNLVHRKILRFQVYDDGLECHPKRRKQLFKKTWICRNTCVLFWQFINRTSHFKILWLLYLKASYKLMHTQ